MIAGALTGGIGFAAGAAFSGAKYEYADSYNLTATKPKYKGKELEKLQSEGVHVIVVNKKTASAEMESARNSCKSSAAPTSTTQAVQPAAPQAAPPPAPAVAPVSGPTTQTVQPPAVTPVPASAPLCTASIIDANGNQTCTQYAIAAAASMAVAQDASLKSRNGQVVDVQPYTVDGSTPYLIPNASGVRVGAIPSSTQLATVTIKLDQGTYSAIFNGKFASKIVVGSDVEARVDGDKLVIDWPGEKEQKSKIIRRAQ